MANEEQLEFLKQGAEVWNKWRNNNPGRYVNFGKADLHGAILFGVDLRYADLIEANLANANLAGANLDDAKLSRANLIEANLSDVSLRNVDLNEADLSGAFLTVTELVRADLRATNFSKAEIASAVFGNSDLSACIGLADVHHRAPSTVGIDTIRRSKGKIPPAFLQGCGLSDADIEYTKLYNPEINNEEINKILYKIYDLRATQALQISPLFVSYSHEDSKFVDKIGNYLTYIGVRYWRDIHDMKSGRLEKQIDQAIRQNPTVLLVLSEHSLNSDWVEHEVHTARGLEKELGRDVLCPVALDDTWKNSKWEKRIMEQVMKYNILDFSAWRDDSKFDGMFRKLIDGLELFYKG